MSDTPFPCPECGKSDWKADYYEAVSQTIDLFVGDDGKVEFGDYTGGLDSYDDGSTQDEAWVCRGCDHRIVLGEFKFVEEGKPAAYVVSVRHPDYESTFEVIGQPIEFLELDLGGSFDITKWPSELDLKTARDMVEHLRAEVEEAPEALREPLRAAVENALTSFDRDDWRTVLQDAA